MLSSQQQQQQQQQQKLHMQQLHMLQLQHQQQQTAKHGRQQRDVPTMLPLPPLPPLLHEERPSFGGPALLWPAGAPAHAAHSQQQQQPQQRLDVLAPAAPSSPLLGCIARSPSGRVPPSRNTSDVSADSVGLAAAPAAEGELPIPIGGSAAGFSLSDLLGAFAGEDALQTLLRAEDQSTNLLLASFAASNYAQPLLR